MDLSLKDLKVIDAVYRTHSISAAADAIGLSQPSISMRLSNLRTYFDDQLFIRTSAGMHPTPRADQIIEHVRLALGILENGLIGRPSFVPTESERSFRICMTDAGQIVVMPRLLDRLNELAPNVRVEVKNLDEDTPRLLEMGHADLAMGYTQGIRAGFHQRRLFKEHMVCMVRKGHPRIGNTISLEEFLEERHVAVVMHGTAHWRIEKALEEQSISRSIAVSIPSFLGLAQIVASTPLVALVQAHLGTILSQSGNVKLLDAPVSIPSYDVTLYWHERYHQDPANQWLRLVLVDLLGENA
ncbi:LysR family transcriptional regulator [Paraburkholderia sp. GV068]|uniref:LysR family transcriptional regulator n=1 Tax=Paraburkholderia TaxID=1822464 RepID=UPI000D3227F4|nr:MULTISPECIES: LysR family transcriptional regulator [unclassified Paraburkholderia]PTQ92106.1 LysR family transcriptional regulator [Paraburkholderia sp. GV072]PUA94316.1 LysR family transcriptional regulator [Paraburkholderia sp. GV068]